MWKQISCLYYTVMFGVYCAVLPSASLALRDIKFSSSKDLVTFSSEISNNQDFQNKEFKSLVKPFLIPRMPDTEGNLKVQNYIKDYFLKLKEWEIEEDRFEDDTPYGRKTFTNIITTYEPMVKNKLVLACHFDSKNMSDRHGNYFIAASDSAVPCAIMMDVAKKLKCSLNKKKINRKRSLSEDVTLQLMFFDGEEAYKTWKDTDSLYGSRHLAKRLRETEDPYYPGTTRLDNVELFVLLDLIGTADVNFQSFFTKTDKVFKSLQRIVMSRNLPGHSGRGRPTITWFKCVKADMKIFSLDDIAPNNQVAWKACVRDSGYLLPIWRSEDKLIDKGLLNTNGLRRKSKLFSSHRPWGAVEDDHKPFLKERKDLPVLHLISTPFPRVWHTMEDNEKNINYDVTDNFNRIFRVFVASYLKVPATACPR